MPRPVAPWTWRRALRDYGPARPSFRLAMLTLGTWMNRDGEAFPSQDKWARGACMTVRSIQRHLAFATRTGWLGVALAGRTGQGWRHNLYRAAIPDGVPLDGLDEDISDALQDLCGGIESTEGDDKAMSAPASKGGDSIVSSRCNDRAEGDDRASKKVTTGEAEGDDMESKKVTTELCRTNSRSENSHRTPAKNEARLSPSGVSAMDAKPKNGTSHQDRSSPPGQDWRDEIPL